MGKIKVKPVFNKSNGQINFSLKKRCFPKEFKVKLNRLKSINLDEEDFDFDEW